MTLPDAQPVVSLEIVNAYRLELEDVWGIRPTADGREIDARLETRERKEWHQFMRKLAAGDDRATVGFYDWLSTRRRVGAVHSYKWAEILVSGVWGGAVVRTLAPERVLDLGCNVGYWSTWMAGDREVVGVDRSVPAISLARTIAGDLGRRSEFVAADFSNTDLAPDRYDCVVSLQGLQHEFTAGNYRAVEGAARHLRPGGHLVMVEGGLPDASRISVFDEALHTAGLSVLATADCGGIGFGRNPWHYLGIVAVKDDRSHGSIAGCFDDEAREPLYAWAECLPDDLWPEMNSAYLWAGTNAPPLGYYRQPPTPS